MRKFYSFLCGMALVLAIVGTAQAAVILFEDFEDSSRFTIGGSAAGYWGIAPFSGTATYPSGFLPGTSGQAGMIFYGAQAKEYDQSPASTLTISLPDLSGYTNLTLTVALAGADGVWENTHRDSLHIIGGTTTSPPSVPCVTAGCMPVTGAIDDFLPDGYGGNFQSQVYPTIDLHPQFQDFAYAIDSSLKSITFAFASSGGDEVVGIDSVRITGDPIVAPVAIDIRPWSDMNLIVRQSPLSVPVAILSSATFNAPEQVAQGSLTFGRTGDEPSLHFCGSHPVDIDRDGYKDLVCLFHIRTAAFQKGDTEGTLKGKTVSGVPLVGSDAVRVLGW